MSVALFITATGTEVGKTLVTAALGAQLKAHGLSPQLLKPVMTGYDPAAAAASDAAVLLDALDTPLTEAAIARISPYRFAAPLAPSMAAALEGRTLDLDALVAFCKGAMAASSCLLIEGVGGVMVPLGPGVTVLDWMDKLGLPVVLVTGSYLGTLSHTLTAIEVLRARKLPIAGIVVSETEQSTVDLNATVWELIDFTALPVLALPRLPGDKPWRTAPDLLMLAGGR